MDALAQMPRGARALTCMLVAGVAVYAAQIVLRIVPLDTAEPFMKCLANLVFFGSVLLCGWRAVAIRRERAGWALLAAGMLLWGIGDLYYTLALWDLEEVPIPSPADGLYLAFYLLAYAGLVRIFGARVARLGRTLWVDGLVGALGVAAFAATVLFGAVVSSTGGAPLSVATNLAYPLADLLLAAFAVAALAMTGWSLRSAWAWLAVGLLVIAATDAVYLYGTAAGTYDDGDLVDVGWQLAPVVIAVAAWLPAPEAERRRAASWRALALPLGFGLACVGLLVYDHFVTVNWLAVFLAATAMVAVLARLALTFAENVRVLATCRNDARTDALTGLGNRRALMADLDAALASGGAHVLALFDLDGFKDYNDTFGHPAGDSLLERIAASLDGFIAARGGRAYRIGGDEFCILCAAADDVEHTVAEAAFALTERGECFSVGCSFGSILIPAEAASPADALRTVDQRMYAHKQDGRASAGRQSKDVLRRALLERNAELGRHATAVGQLAEAVARRLEVPEAEIETIRLAAELCNVGMVSIPDGILHKPGPLSEAETEFVQRHPIVGERILAAAPSLAGVAPLVRSSHERIDGRGYPDGLSGDAIPFGARIVFACDSFVTMLCERPYAGGATRADAFAELRSCAGTQFDRRVVEALCDLLAEPISSQGSAGPPPA